MVAVSVIIPVYNVEQYLRECLDSVVNQTLKDIEIICVNDGSTDNSLAILEEYAKKDERIKVISQENQGVSVARNVGIENANSEYIMFLDSDDTLEAETCELSLQKIIEKDADICCFGINEIENGVKQARHWEEKALQLITDNNFDINEIKPFLANACGKLFKKSFITNNNIFFPPKIKTGEDAIFNLYCLFNNAKYTVLNKALYNYLIIRSGSATNSLKNAVANDIEGYKLFLNSDFFKTLPDFKKVIAIEKFIGQLHYYYTMPTIYKFIYFFQIMTFRKYLFNKISIDIIKQATNLKYIHPNIFWKIIFSLNNQQTGILKYKILTIFGITLKFKRR